jgi:hypothetical protein
MIAHAAGSEMGTTLAGVKGTDEGVMARRVTEVFVVPF